MITWTKIKGISSQSPRVVKNPDSPRNSNKELTSDLFVKHAIQPMMADTKGSNVSLKITFLGTVVPRKQYRSVVMSATNRSILARGTKMRKRRIFVCGDTEKE